MMLASLAFGLLFGPLTVATPLGSFADRPPEQKAAVEAGSVLPFFEDDYASALAEAKAKGQPLFVDAWAPWCHTCRSMRAYVFTDPALASLADRLVWLEVDTEKDENAAFVRKFPLEAWPTLFIIDPRTEGVLIRRLGSATVEQMHELVAEGERAFAGVAKGWREALARADRLYGERRNAEAAAAYAEALAGAPASWRERGRAVESYLFALAASEQPAKCVAEALALYGGLRDGAAAVNVAVTGLDCALSLPAGDASRAAAVLGLERVAREVLANPRVVVEADDRSGIYLTLHAAREDAKDEEGARAVAREWAAFLDAEAQKAESADARAVFDAHRLSAYRALGQTERALPMLEASERDLPHDYNPPARLAIALQALKRHEDALAASHRALAKVEGPRRITVLRIHAEILEAKGDKPAARKALEEALSIAERQPPGERADRAIAALKQRLAAQ